MAGADLFVLLLVAGERLSAFLAELDFSCEVFRGVPGQKEEVLFLIFTVKVRICITKLILDIKKSRILHEKVLCTEFWGTIYYDVSRQDENTPKGYLVP